MQADFDGAVRIAQLAAGFDWSWTVANVEQFCQEAGWRSEPLSYGGTELHTGLSVSQPWGRAEHASEFLRECCSDGGEVKELRVLVTDVADDATSEGHIWLVDSFAELAERLTLEVGPPLGPVNIYGPTVVWNLANAVLLLSTHIDHGTIQLKIADPVYRQWEIECADDDDDSDEDEQAELSGSDGDQVFPRTWLELTTALALTLSRLSVGAQVELAASRDRIARFDMGWQTLECSVSRSAARRTMGHLFDDDRAHWFSLGWSWTAINGEQGWGRSIEWPARYREFEAMADAVVIALRDELKVAHPKDLRVQASPGDSGRVDISAFDLEP
ncbi:DUF6301 family protein [Nocardia sp. NPDC004722]